jgi:tRNA-specific 2-thiouridylase
MARVAVLMSGGIDSTAAAVLLKRAGHDVIGLTARLLLSASRCCDADDLYRAQRICHKLGIPHITLDLRQEFERNVVDEFFEAYFDGLTPNPCARCNREIKLGKMLGLAVRSGFDRVATGHYARIRLIAGRYAICEPVDRRKSQTYFLALVRQAALEYLVFPLSRLRKEEARRIVSGMNLPVRDGESQDLCFIPTGAYRKILEARWNGPGEGNVLDVEGNVVGSHKGHYAYTIGQRLGREGRRYYVVEKRASTNEIVVAERGQTLKTRIRVRDINRYVPLSSLEGKRLRVKYRYNSAPVTGKILESKSACVVVATDEACFAPAPGQILACYLDDCLVFGGIIDRAD